MTEMIAANRKAPAIPRTRELIMENCGRVASPVWWSGIAETARPAVAFSVARSEDGDAVYLGGRIDRWDERADAHFR